MISNRRYDIDWLRVIAIGLLIIYHVAIGFQPWGVFIGFIQNNESLESIWIPMSILNIWRIPILFFISGIGVWFAIQHRDWKGLLLERAKRILLPFVFGMMAIVPLHILLWREYYHQEIQYIFQPAHLWFLGNIFIYVLILAPIFFYLKNVDNKFRKLLTRLFSNPLGLLVIIIPFILEAEVVRPENFELYAMTEHGFFIGLIAFTTGFCCVYSGNVFWNTVKKWRWAFLIIASILFVVRLKLFELQAPYYLISVESNLWIFAVFGFGHRYLNQPGKILEYLKDAAYPVYIMHMFFLYLGSLLIFGMNLSPVVKFIMLNLFTLIGSLLCYELFIGRIYLLRPLFGLKVKDLHFSLSKKMKAIWGNS